ncbi:protein SGT1 homolog isoform X3 [Symphalangus syndactylus]|uniref:protein SGT1 homolog isoform X3 n=1 Tax=Symphalangus syndactylus TaxID=9590 RepID=UPI0024420346|nr:protein SGT1 homolog isoform X4 [Symphalangus syndactylus]
MAPRPLSLGRVPASALADAARLPTLSELTKALEQKPDDAQYYRQRAYCHILLGNYCGNFSYKMEFCSYCLGWSAVAQSHLTAASAS